METETQRLWRKQERHPGDRENLFRAAASVVSDGPVLYPGSFVDVAASRVFTDVTYVDTDARAAAFFSDEEGVDEIVGETNGQWSFLHADYTSTLPLSPRSFSVLISLYAGLVSDHCTAYLRPTGWLLANTSHGDVAVAAQDRRYQLEAVIERRRGTYAVRVDDLGGFLEPRSGSAPSASEVRASGRGVRYRRSATAYVFRFDP